MKKTIVVLFGGESVEHDISIITGVQALRTLQKVCDVMGVYIDKKGIWWAGENFEDSKIFEDFERFAKKKRQVSFLLGTNTLLVKKQGKFVPFKDIDAVVNCCHGNVGEDGSVQGLLKVCGVAHSSPNVLSSALCMDKVFMKNVLNDHSIQTPKHCVLKKEEFKAKGLLDVSKTLPFPLVVKPARLGSSIGIGVANNMRQLKESVDVAFEFDEKVLCEEMVTFLREFNCACFNFKGDIFLSRVNEVENKSEIFSFEDKYLSKKNKSKHPDKNLEKEIKGLTEKVYKLFECRGIVRVDFLFNDEKKVLYVNEINTIPGSLAFYLFEDLKFEDVLLSIVEQAQVDFKKDKQFVKTFESDALKIFNQEIKMLKK